VIIRSGLSGLGVTLLRSVSVNLAELRRAQTRDGRGGNLIWECEIRNSEFEKREGRKGKLGIGWLTRAFARFRVKIFANEVIGITLKN